MNKIKIVLEQKGVKQKWLAEKLGKSFNMINSYAQNRSQPSIETLYKIASILEVGVDELLYTKEELNDNNLINKNDANSKSN
jgi:repressor LexA